MSETYHPDLSEALPKGAEYTAQSPASRDIEPEKYLPELAEFDLTDAQKRELLETLWSIMRSFVEMGFRAELSGQVLGSLFEIASEAQNSLPCLDAKDSPYPLSGDGQEG